MALDSIPNTTKQTNKQMEEILTARAAESAQI
jgi:hypothetical protein